MRLIATDKVEASVEANYAHLVRRYGPRIQQVMARIASLQDGVATPTQLRKRQARLYAYLDEMGEMLGSVAPCARGCNYCCHMAVTVTTPEAELIAATTGLPLVHLPAPSEADILSGAMDAEREVDREAFTGTACPFLKSGECSIYEVRPVACRSYFNLADYPVLCDTSTQQDVPSFDMSVAAMTSVVLALQVPGSTCADIRRFFPTLPEGN